MIALAAALVALAVGVAAVLLAQRVRRGRALGHGSAARRIAFPFTGSGLSEPALAAALRIAGADGAALLPVYLALVPLDVPLDVPLSSECEAALPLLETIEHRAARAGVRVDSRIERGRTARHALAQLIAHERFERMVVAASSHDRRGDGFSPEDVAWLLDTAPGEVIALRPAPASISPARPRPVSRSRTAPVPPGRGRDRLTARGRSVADRVAHDVAGGGRRL